MKVLTAAQMRELDRLTIESGIPGLILMENAGSRVVDFLLETFAPLREHRVAVICGKGNNGGDGFVIARQLFSRRLCESILAVELFDPETLTGDARDNRRMLQASAARSFARFRTNSVCPRSSSMPCSERALAGRPPVGRLRAFKPSISAFR